MAMPSYHVEVNEKRYLVTDQPQLVNIDSWDDNSKRYLLVFEK